MPNPHKFQEGNLVRLVDNPDWPFMLQVLNPDDPAGYIFGIRGVEGQWNAAGQARDPTQYADIEPFLPTTGSKVVKDDAHPQPGVFTMASPGYEALARVLLFAFQQSSQGKGRERHANSLPFHQQPILANGRVFGEGFTSGQAVKKLQELHGMIQRGKLEAAKAEALGAIVYTAATYLLIEEMEDNKEPASG